MKRILVAAALACALSGTVLASDMPTVGAAAPCADMPSCGAPAATSQSSAVANALLTVINLVVR